MAGEAKFGHDAALKAIRRELKAHADSKHAKFHKGYHKAPEKFYGLRTPEMRKVLKSVIPARQKITLAEAKPLFTALWESGWFEEKSIALDLLRRTAKDLTPADIPWLHSLTRGCNGWAHLDHLAAYSIGTLVLNHGEKAYKPIRRWTQDEYMWTRRASILTHLLPGREGRLDGRYSWPTFTELLGEQEFFIRKAIGWTLREIGKQRPEDVAEYLRKHRSEMSGLTFREGVRNLPDALQDYARGG